MSTWRWSSASVSSLLFWIAVSSTCPCFGSFSRAQWYLSEIWGCAIRRLGWQELLHPGLAGRPGGDEKQSRAAGASPESWWLCQDLLRLMIARKVNCPRRNGRVELAWAAWVLCHLICSWVRCSEDGDWDCTCWEWWTFEILLWIKQKQQQQQKRQNKKAKQNKANSQ